MRASRYRVGLAVVAFVLLGLRLSLSLASGDCDGDGDVDYVDFEDFMVCMNGPGTFPDPLCVCFADFDVDSDSDLADYAVFQASFDATGVEAPRPAKFITFDQIPVHDPASDQYDPSCTAAECHGDRTQEVALDGVNPASHRLMPGFFGVGDDRCTACHSLGIDLVNGSAGALRVQVDMENVIGTLGCPGCHGPGNPDNQWYMRP